MTTFYAVPSLEELPRIRDEGLNEYTLYDDYDNAVEHAWEGETVVVSVEVDDPDKALFPDDEAVDRLYEQLSSMSRTVRPGEEAPLQLVDFAGTPITWDDPWALERVQDLYKYITELEDAPEPTWRDSFEDFGTAILEEQVPPDRIMLMTPVDLSEIESKAEYRKAVEEMQPVALSSLGAAFWVWLIFYMSQIFGPEWGKQAEAEEAERKAKKRRARRKPSRKKKAKKRKRRKRKPAELGAAW